ncbi:unnamed protein product [Lampetra fluviatilis]
MQRAALEHGKRLQLRVVVDGEEREEEQLTSLPLGVFDRLTQLTLLQLSSNQLQRAGEWTPVVILTWVGGSSVFLLGQPQRAPLRGLREGRHWSTGRDCSCGLLVMERNVRVKARGEVDLGWWLFCVGYARRSVGPREETAAAGCW